MRDTDNVLCYMDQGSFMGLRALGRGLVLHLTWVYPHPLDEAAVNTFNERIAQGLLGRVLQRSPLPWGRHRWVARTVPAPVTWYREPIPAECLAAWRRSLVDLRVDPEHGPGWRLAVQSIAGGGSALSFMVSHTTADGLAMLQAIADALAGRPFTPGFPAPSWRWSPAMLARDFMESARALPDVWRALAALVRGSPAGQRMASHRPPPESTAPDTDVEVPLVQVTMEAGAFDARASDLGVRGNALLAAFAVRLAFRTGRIEADGCVRLVLPVSDRKPGDRRGNALQSITIMADPGACQSNPLALQHQMKAALDTLRQQGDEMSVLLPLVPYVPLWLARHMERMAIGAGRPVGCSILGELPPELASPFGETSIHLFSTLERYTASALERLGGQLLLVCYRTGGRVFISVIGYAPGRLTSREALVPLVRDALEDMGLDGSVS